MSCRYAIRRRRSHRSLSFLLGQITPLQFIHQSGHRIMDPNMALILHEHGLLPIFAMNRLICAETLLINCLHLYLLLAKTNCLLTPRTTYKSGLLQRYPQNVVNHLTYIMQ